MVEQAPQMMAIRSPVRWAGSKSQLIPSLSKYWRASGSNRYLEAFCGSAAFFFNVAPSMALLNDSNGELVNSLAILRAYPRLLHHELTGISKCEETFYRLRSQDASDLDNFERAVRFFYLNRYCFNGIYRTNRQGKFNVPYGREKTGKFPGLADWVRAADVLARARLCQEDFECFVKNNVKQGDFVYMDPPYAVSNRRVFAQYSENSFGLSDMQRLSELLVSIDRMGGRFVVSYAQSPESKLLSGGWIVRRQFAQRHVAGFATHRKRALEVFISNFEP